MIQDSEGNDPIQRVRSIYANGNQSAITEASNLLIEVLREGDGDSRLALEQIFDLPISSRQDSQGAKLDAVLISRVRVFINGSNANRVQAWLSSYERSLPYSRNRAVLESIMREFVASRSQIEAMTGHLAQARTLRADASLKCSALKGVIENMSKSVG
jgi:hypothetical protein